VRDRNLRLQVPVVGRALAGEEATGTYVSPIDGAERLAGAVPIEPLGWVALASVPTAQAMAPAVSNVIVENIVFLAVGIAGLTLALGLSRLLTGPIDRASQSAQAIGRGDLTQRPQVDRPEELARLAAAITVMAEQLQQREELRSDNMTCATRWPPSRGRASCSSANWRAVATTAASEPAPRRS